MRTKLAKMNVIFLYNKELHLYFCCNNKTTATVDAHDRNSQSLL